MISFKDYITELATPGPKLSSKQIVKRIKKLRNQVPTLKGWDKIFSKFDAKELHSRKDLEGMLPAKVARGDINRLFFEELDPRKHDAGDYVKDFQKSDAPQFKGKSKEKRRQMAIAAYLDARRDAGLGEGKKNKPESFEAQFKRRVVKTTKPEHKEKGYNWRIKGKDRPEISIKLYKNKPSFSEFKKQLRRVAGHEFG